MALMTLSMAANGKMSGNDRRLRDTLCKLRRLTRHVIIFRHDKRRFVEWLGELYAQLAIHIELEEARGYVEGVTDNAPHLAERAGKLRAEHVTLMESLRHIFEDAERWYERNMSWIDGGHERRGDGFVDGGFFCRIVSKFRQFDEQLSQHEHAENALILEAADTDIGGEA